MRFVVTSYAEAALRFDVRSGQGEIGGTMSLQSHIEVLKERHAGLEMRICDEDNRPRPDSETLARLKLEKLRLKEEMERLQHHKG
jgi:hypothetical protein